MITIVLTNYIVNIYTDTFYNIEELSNLLNNQEYPRGIVDILSQYNDITKIEVLSPNGDILLINNNAIE